MTWRPKKNKGSEWIYIHSLDWIIRLDFFTFGQVFVLIFQYNLRYRSIITSLFHAFPRVEPNESRYVFAWATFPNSVKHTRLV